MSSVSSAPLNIFNAEFLSSPAATAAAWISIIGAVILICKLIGALFQYRKSHNEILKKSGVPAFILNVFFITIPLKNLPAPGWPEKIITIAFSFIFILAVYFFMPALIQTYKTPPDTALLYWKKTGEAFYISKKMATSATIFAPANWTISADDCLQKSPTSTRQYNALTIENKENLCSLLTTQDGINYIEKSIKKFNKDKFFMYSFVPLTMFILLWLPLGFMLTIHYSRKVRRYILNEQKKAIHCAHGEFKTEGIYAIYQELDR